MSAKVFGKVWELQIDPIEKLVLLALADHADHEGNNVRPGNKLLCAKTGLSERTIGLKIADFLERGILLPVQTTTGRGNIREFAIDVDAIPRSQYFINREKLKIEAGSTFRPSQRSKQDQPLSEPERLEKVEADNTKVEVDGSAYKEGTVMNLIGDIDIPQTPSLVENPKANFPLANDDAQSVQVQPCRNDINGMCVNHPYTMEGCTEPGRLYRLKAEKDWQAKQAALTVHANGGYATPPEVAAPPPAQNGQLCVLSPLTESTTTDQPETVKVESDPVSAKSKRGSRKTEKQDSPEGIQRKADHRNLMDYLQTQTGQTIINGAAQAGALKRILGAYTATQAQEVLDYQLAGNWRGPVSWLSVQTQIADYFRRKEQSQTKLGGNNGKSRLWEFCNSRPLGQF